MNGRNSCFFVLVEVDNATNLKLLDFLKTHLTTPVMLIISINKLHNLWLLSLSMFSAQNMLSTPCCCYKSSILSILTVSRYEVLRER